MAFILNFTRKLIGSNQNTNEEEEKR